MKKLLIPLLMLSSCASTPQLTDVCPVQGNNAPKSIRTKTCIETDKPTAKSFLGVSNLWGRNSTVWKQDVLTICFLNGSKRQHDKTKKYAEIWLQHCGLKFVWLDNSDPNADIRISYSCGGHWSYIGSYCKNVPKGRATMNIELTSWDIGEDWRRVVLHEFGHALGLEHEQAHPESDIRPEPLSTIEFYKATNGWSAEKTYQQVLSKYMGNDWHGTDYDRSSIMHYPFPPELTIDGKGVGWNTELSAKDIEEIGKMYPKQ